MITIYLNYKGRTIPRCLCKNFVFTCIRYDRYYPEEPYIFTMQNYYISNINILFYNSVHPNTTFLFNIFKYEIKSC